MQKGLNRIIHGLFLMGIAVLCTQCGTGLGLNGARTPSNPGGDPTVTEEPEFTSNMEAYRVIGQATFTTATANLGGIGPTTLNGPDGVFSDGTKFAVVDRGNHRVLLFNSTPTTDRPTADLVLGQTDYTSSSSGLSATKMNGPRSVSFDGTRLYVSDTGNSRILVWPAWPTTLGEGATIVLGQNSLTGGTANQGGAVAANGFDGRFTVSAYATTSHIFVADSGNNRSLIFTPPPSTNQSAAIAIGQVNLTATAFGATATTMTWPMMIWSDEQYVCIADNNNHRVLLYSSVPSSSGATVSVVLGQANATSGTANRGGAAAANTISSPHACVIGGGRLFVADAGNHRVLVWNTIPTSDGAPADVVLGQASFSAASANQGGTVSARTLNKPTYLAHDGSTLWVVDQQNHRVVGFQ